MHQAFYVVAQLNECTERNNLGNFAIGDGANDLLMLKSAGRGIAFCAKEVVKSEIACHVDTRDFLEVLPLIDFLE